MAQSSPDVTPAINGVTSDKVYCIGITDHRIYLPGIDVRQPERCNRVDKFKSLLTSFF